MKIKKQYYFVVIGIISLISIYLLSVFPPSGDDFNRFLYLNASFKDIVKEALGTHSYLNGRILGNGLSFLFVTRGSKIVVKFLLISAIIVLVGKITNRKFTSFLFSILSLLFLDISIFREDIVWNAGFFNYIPPVFLLLLLGYISVYMKDSNKKDILVFILAFSSCLFMENISLYMLFFPFILYFVSNISKKNAGISFIASLIGNIVMFSSPVYMKIFTKEDTYRTLANDNIIESIKINWKVFQKYLSLGSYLIHILILLILVYMLYKIIKEKDYKYIGINVISVISSIGIILTKSEEHLLFNLVMHILYYGSILLMSNRLDGRYKNICIFASISMAISMGPLLFISPVGARNFFSSYILNLLIFFSLLFGNKLDFKDFRLYNAIILIVITRLVFLSYIYTINWNEYKKIENYVKESAKNNERQLILWEYPYPEYMHDQAFDKLINHYYKKNNNKIPEF